MVKIELGCGNQKAQGYIGLDINLKSSADIICDCSKTFPFRDDSIDEIRAWNFLEHLYPKQIIPVMDEIWRVLRDDGALMVRVPDAERGQGAFQDPTHHSFWVKNSFKYYANDYYRKLYDIKANFAITDLRDEEWENSYWGKNYAITAHLRAVKTDIKSRNPDVNLTKFRRSINFDQTIIICDDVCPSNLQYWHYWDRVKAKYPKLKVIAFVVANYKNQENIAQSKEFRDWYEKYKGWVTIGVHGYDHLSPPECERDDQEELIKKALNILRPFLPEKFLFRAPGYQHTIKTNPILKKLGFAGIAHQTRIKFFDGTRIEPIFNTHLYEDKYENPIGKIWDKL